MHPIIQSLWIGDDLTNLEKLCIQSFLDHGHKFHLYTYTNIGGIPAGAMIKDGNEILPESAIFRNRGGSVAGFSDWFRYALLVKRGGIWMDMDMVCIRAFDFDDEILLVNVGEGLLTTAVIGMPPNHSMMVALEKSCREHKKREGSKFGEVGGPVVITRFIDQFGLRKYAKPYTHFVPLEPNQCFHLFNATFAGNKTIYEDTYSIHFSNEMLRGAGYFDKNAVFHKDSFFEMLKAKHGIANKPDAKKITPADLDAMVVARAMKRTKRQKKQKYIVPFVLAIIAALVISNVFFLLR